MLLAGLGPLNSRFRELIFNCLSFLYFVCLLLNCRNYLNSYA